MSSGLRLRAMTLVLAMGAWAGGGLCAVPADGPPVLPLTLVDVETGLPVKLEAGAKVLHVVVVATWCRPCEDELPLLAEWEARFGAGGYRLAVVALNRRQTRDRLLSFARERRPPGRLYFDASGETQRSLAVDGIPAHYLLDAEGRVRIRAGSLGEIGTASVEDLLGERKDVPGERDEGR